MKVCERPAWPQGCLYLVVDHDSTHGKYRADRARHWQIPTDVEPRAANVSTTDVVQAIELGTPVAAKKYASRPDSVRRTKRRHEHEDGEHSQSSISHFGACAISHAELGSALPMILCAYTLRTVDVAQEGTVGTTASGSLRRDPCHDFGRSNTAMRATRRQASVAIEAVDRAAFRGFVRREGTRKLALAEAQVVLPRDNVERQANTATTKDDG